MQMNREGLQCDEAVWRLHRMEAFRTRLGPADRLRSLGSDRVGFRIPHPLRATVVAVSAGQRDGQRGAAPVGDQVVLAARTCAVDWRRSGVSPP